MSLSTLNLPSALSSSVKPSPLTPDAAALQRLDDKIATGMTIADVANARWLTAVEVLQYLDTAIFSQTPGEVLWDEPPTSPPTTGTLLLYNSKRTPNYAEDGLNWTLDVDQTGDQWKSIEGVIRTTTENEQDSNSNSDRSQNTMNVDSALESGAWAQFFTCTDRQTFHRREYRAGPDNNDIVLLHYLDSVRALRMTNELVDRIVMLSAEAPGSARAEKAASKAAAARKSAKFANVTPPPPNVDGHVHDGKLLASTTTNNSSGGGASSSSSSGVKWSADAISPQSSPSQVERHARSKSRDLGDTMNILQALVDDNDNDVGLTTVVADVDEPILDAANEAAICAVIKHISPEEAAQVVDAIEMAIEENNDVGGDGTNDNLGGGGGEIGLLDGEVDMAIEDIHQLTEFDIDDAIDQVLTGAGGGNDDDDDILQGLDRNNNPEVDSINVSDDMSEAASSSLKDTAKLMEEKILDSMEEVLPDELKAKLINTTERMLKATGVSLVEMEKMEPSPMSPMIFGDSVGAVSAKNMPLPEMIDMTPNFHIMGQTLPTAPFETKKWKNDVQSLSMVVSTETPVPELPPYVDQYYVWERFAAFVNFQSVVDDPHVRGVSFQKLKPLTLTSSSYKCLLPQDIPFYSIRHIVIVGVLLPKDHRTQRNMRGIELALKLCLQTEWWAADDLVGATPESKALIEKKESKSLPQIRGISRPLFMAPCGGARMQLLSQISQIRFTIYADLAAPTTMGAPNNFIEKVAMKAEDMGADGDKGRQEKRRRDNFLEEWAAAPGNDASMSTAEVDRHRKVRFVERISKAIVSTTAVSENDILEGVDVDNMNEDEIDGLLGKVLLRFVEVLVEETTNQEELLGEINFCGYAGLSLLHHSCVYDFRPLISLLLNNGADPNLGSAEGDIKPLHFAAAAGHKDVVDMLIRHGCHPCPVDVNNQTPEDHARKAGHMEIAMALNALTEQSGLRRSTPFHANGIHAETSNTTDSFLQSAFKELSIKDKLGLNLFADRSNAAPLAFVNTHDSPARMNTAGGSIESNAPFSFISKEDRVKLREAMSLASDMDIKEMNFRADHQDVRRYLRQSNCEAIHAASTAMAKANKKESDILKSVESTNDLSKKQLSRALAMLVLRKNLPS